MTSTASTTHGIADALFAPWVPHDLLDRVWPDEAAALAPHPDRAALFPTLAQTPVADLVARFGNPVHALGSDERDGALTSVPSGPAALEAMRGGQSLCLSGAHTTYAEVRRALLALTETLGVPVTASQCNAYVSPAGEGVPWHFDDREVLVVQVQGSKRWTLAPNREVTHPTENFVLATGGPAPGDELAAYGPARYAGPAPDDCHEVLMSPGSAVFMPRGTWHRTQAEEPSLSLTFGIFTPTPLDLLPPDVRRARLADERFRRPLGAATGTQRAASEARVERLVRELSQVGQDDPGA